MMTRKQREIRQQLELLRQATAAKLTRREALKMGLLAGTAGILNTGAALAQTGDDPVDTTVSNFAPSPPTTPWVEAMPVPARMPTSSAFAPSSPRQYWSRFPAVKHHKTYVKAAPHVFHPDLGAPSTIWGFDGKYPGNTLDMKYGQPVLLRVYNQLPSLASHTGFGIPQVINHLHNFHTAPESDGGPWNWSSPGGFNDHHYCLARAGFSQDPGLYPEEHRTWHPNGAFGGDGRETLTTLFMHAHRAEFTAANVYKGQALMARIFDERDTGNEQDSNPLAFRLPSGPHDVPIVLCDKQFDSQTGQLVFDQFNDDGFLGDKTVVNGKIQPFFNVKRRKYRFRILCNSVARMYRLVLRHDGVNLPFHIIADNGNLLERPVIRTMVEFWPAERDDIIVDFTHVPEGAKVYLCNNMAMESGRKAARNDFINPDDANNQLIEFRVGATVSDPSRIPTFFRPFPEINLSDVVQTRHFRFERTNGMWAINGQLWDPQRDHSRAFLNNPTYQIQRNSAEVWVLENSSGGWEHPVHIHLEEGQIITDNGQVPSYRIREDMYRIGKNTTQEVFLRFRDFPDPDFYADPTKPGHPNERNRYVMHCHNLSHEDHAMMTTFNIMP
jgi:FtsP/CotA-like multicopper oxidase with cupredoxin domain